jgi:outer membrane lipoprotein SlyB
MSALFRPLHRRSLSIALLASLGLSGCVSTQVDEAPPSFETLQVLRNRDIPMVALGEFVLAPGVGRTVSIRGSTMGPPKGGNYAGFLGSTFEKELRAAGKFDSAAVTRISGVLTESRAGENLSTGKAALAARIAVSRDGKELFTKPYRVETQWKSDFIGAIAIPDAFMQYNSLYALLVRQVFADPEFIMAVRQQ